MPTCSANLKANSKQVSRGAKAPLFHFVHLPNTSASKIRIYTRSIVDAVHEPSGRFQNERHFQIELKRAPWNDFNVLPTDKGEVAYGAFSSPVSLTVGDGEKTIRPHQRKIPIRNRWAAQAPPLQNIGSGLIHFQQNAEPMPILVSEYLSKRISSRFR
jgi:hypothetical protein